MLKAISNIEEFFAPTVPEICKFWMSKSAGRRSPSRQEIDVIDMPKINLPQLMLAEFERDPFRIKFRLVGTGIGRQYDLDYTGLYINEIAFPADLEAAAESLYRQVWEHGEPIVGHYGYPTASGRQVLSEFALLPLESDGIVTHCLAVEHLDPRDEAFPDSILPVRRKD